MFLPVVVQCVTVCQWVTVCVSLKTYSGGFETLEDTMTGFLLFSSILLLAQSAK